jgi:hypothetical protein
MELLEQIKADILSVKTEGKADINECYSVKKNGNSIECRVETIENGFIITVNKDCSIPMKSGFKDYEYENKKYFSATNPFEKMDKKEEAEKSIMTAMQEFLSMKETAKQVVNKLASKSIG